MPILNLGLQDSLVVCHNGWNFKVDRRCQFKKKGHLVLLIEVTNLKVAFCELIQFSLTGYKKSKLKQTNLIGTMKIPSQSKSWVLEVSCQIIYYFMVHSTILNPPALQPMWQLLIKLLKETFLQFFAIKHLKRHKGFSCASNSLVQSQIKPLCKTTICSFLPHLSPSRIPFSCKAGLHRSLKRGGVVFYGQFKRQESSVSWYSLITSISMRTQSAVKKIRWFRRNHHGSQNRHLPKWRL